MELDLRTGMALVGAGFLILWRTLVRRIERHDELCAADRKRLRLLEDKLLEVGCGQVCVDRKPISFEDFQRKK